MPLVVEVEVVGYTYTDGASPYIYTSGGPGFKFGIRQSGVFISVHMRHEAEACLPVVPDHASHTRWMRAVAASSLL